VSYFGTLIFSRNIKKVKFELVSFFLYTLFMNSPVGAGKWVLIKDKCFSKQIITKRGSLNKKKAGARLCQALINFARLRNSIIG
jgi:hypothetical protein